MMFLWSVNWFVKMFDFITCFIQKTSLHFASHLFLLWQSLKAYTRHFSDSICVEDLLPHTDMSDEYSILRASDLQICV